MNVYTVPTCKKLGTFSTGAEIKTPLLRKIGFVNYIRTIGNEQKKDSCEISQLFFFKHLLKVTFSFNENSEHKITV